MTETLEQTCRRLEHFETPEWAVRAILEKEIMTQYVVDPCVGAGVLTVAARKAGYDVSAIDIHDWGFKNLVTHDFLALEKTGVLREVWAVKPFSILMNPPFSLAEQFVEKSFEYGARKVVCFQRFAWWESAGREEFWQKYPPNRVYICGARADCWRHDLPKDAKGNRFDPVTGKKLAGSPTAHAWFVFEPTHPSGTVLGHIYKGDAGI